MAEEIKKMDLESKDLIAERIEQLKKLFPEIATEGDGSVDFEKLRLILGNEIEEGDERYAFTWPGKMDAIRQSQTPSKATLRPCIEKSRGRDGKDGSFDSDNLYIEGDNLEVLKLLQRSYHGKVKMIYIDPPYNTGNDFIYEDSFGDTIENYKEQASLVNQSNADTSGSYHSNWCSMMYPRLRLARELLSDDGVIFISINNVELNNLLSICNEIFGKNNFIDLFIWEKTQHFGRQKLNSYSNADYIVCFAKKLTANQRKELLVERIKTELEDAPLFNSSNSITTISFPPKSVKFKLSDGIYSQTTSPDYQLLDKVIVSNSTNENNFRLRFRSRWSNSTVQNEISKGTTFLIKTDKFAVRAIYGSDKRSNEAPRQIIFTNAKNPMYTTDRFGSKVKTSENATDQLDNLMGKVFSYPKPSSLVRYFISLLWNETDFSKEAIVLDFFSGSATTAHAVMDLNAKDGGNRKFILVQLPETTDSNSEAFKNGYQTICEIGKERIRRAGDRLKEEIEKENLQLPLDGEAKQLPDIGFRVLKLDESGIVEPEPGQLTVDLVKDGRSDEDIIFEVMLKWGYELTYPIEKDVIEGYPYYSVAGDSLICCMGEDLTTDALEGIAELEPDRVFILDSAFGGSDSLKLNAIQIFKRAGERFRKSIELRTV